jgi:hypothetical protein
MAVWLKRKVGLAINMESAMNILKSHLHKFLATATGAAILGIAPTLASAHPHLADLGVDVAVVAPPPCAPVVVDQVNRVWVPATYRTVCDRVWVPAVTEDREVHTWVPDRFELQDVEYREGHHHYVRQEEVLVPAHDVCESEQVVVTPGHWEDVQRQELVTPGHYQDCGEDCAAPVAVEARPEVRVNFLGGWLHLR